MVAQLLSKRALEPMMFGGFACHHVSEQTVASKMVLKIFLRAAAVHSLHIQIKLCTYPCLRYLCLYFATLYHRKVGLCGILGQCPPPEAMSKFLACIYKYFCGCTLPHKLAFSKINCAMNIRATAIFSSMNFYFIYNS